MGRRRHVPPHPIAGMHLIDYSEFAHAMATRFGYRGPPAVLEQVFAAIDTDRSGVRA